jgi:hypothetical protein
MNTTQRRIWFLILITALLVIPSTVVFAKELGLLTITGPGIKGEVSLDNHDDMMNLEQSGFFDQAKSVKPPENLGQGYNITAHLNLDGKWFPWSRWCTTQPKRDSQAMCITRAGSRENLYKLLTNGDKWLQQLKLLSAI